MAEPTHNPEEPDDGTGRDTRADLSHVKELWRKHTANRAREDRAEERRQREKEAGGEWRDCRTLEAEKERDAEWSAAHPPEDGTPRIGLGEVGGETVRIRIDKPDSSDSADDASDGMYPRLRAPGRRYDGPGR